MFRSDIEPWATDDDNYREDLQELADKVIIGELTRDEAQNNDLHHKYGYYGIDVSCELDVLLRDNAMELAPEWTAYQRKSIDMLLDGYDKIHAILQELKDGEIGATHFVEKLEDIL